jgi:2-oxoglutarate dehydrogenase E1 component
MPEGIMKAWLESSHLNGANIVYIEELYESYLDNSQSVSAEWRELFQNLPKIEGTSVEYHHSAIRDEFRELAKQPYRHIVTSGGGDTKQVKVLQLINAFRFRGHQNANLDPLGLLQRDKIRDLQLSHHDLSENDFDKEFNVGSFAVGQDSMNLGNIYKALKTTYCGSIGAEYMHITDTEEKRWLQQRLESVQSKAKLSNDEKVELLNGLIAADGLEKYLGAKFPGAKRFSLEGGDALVPLL